MKAVMVRSRSIAKPAAAQGQEDVFGVAATRHQVPHRHACRGQCGEHRRRVARQVVEADAHAPRGDLHAAHSGQRFGRRRIRRAVDVHMQCLRGRQRAQQFGERTVGHHLAVIDDDDAVGSSSNSTSGRCTSAQVMFSRRFMPPLKVAGLWRARSARPTIASTSAARVFNADPATPYSAPNSSMLAIAGRSPNSVRSCGTSPMRRLKPASSAASVVPPTVTLPASGAVSPQIMPTVVNPTCHRTVNKLTRKLRKFMPIRYRFALMENRNEPTPPPSSMGRSLDLRSRLMTKSLQRLAGPAVALIACSVVAVIAPWSSQSPPQDNTFPPIKATQRTPPSPASPEIVPATQTRATAPEKSKSVALFTRTPNQPRIEDLLRSGQFLKAYHLLQPCPESADGNDEKTSLIASSEIACDAAVVPSTDAHLKTVLLVQKAVEAGDTEAYIAYADLFPLIAMAQPESASTPNDQRRKLSEREDFRTMYARFYAASATGSVEGAIAAATMLEYTGDIGEYKKAIGLLSPFAASDRTESIKRLTSKLAELIEMEEQLRITQPAS